MTLDELIRSPGGPYRLARACTEAGWPLNPVTIYRWRGERAVPLVHLPHLRRALAAMDDTELLLDAGVI